MPTIDTAADGMLEIIAYPDYPGYENVTGIFTCKVETHVAADTGETYEVRIYSSVLKLIENNDEVKQKLCSCMFRLRAGVADVVFCPGAPLGLPEDILIWHNLEEQHMMWFTVTQAKSYFGPTYENRFGRIERQPWGRRRRETL
jgi:hypothetical protein